MKMLSSQNFLRRYMIVFFIFSFVAFLYAYDGKVENYNSTILAFSYKYGFISRGFIGTVYQCLDLILPTNLMSYEASITVILITTISFYLFFLLFVYKCMNLVKEELRQFMGYIFLFYSINLVPMFAHKRNFGRIDLFMLLFSSIGVLCIWTKKLLWMVIPLSALSVMVHQGYVFLYFNILLAFLFYEYMKNNNRQYGIILVVAVVISAVLLFYFELFSHGSGKEYVDEIIRNATALSRDGKYHETLIDKEILGKDLTEVERYMRVENLIELPFYLLFTSPYWISGISFMKRVVHSAGTVREKWMYRLMFMGGLTTLPCFLLKVDYGRWFFAVISYYVILLVGFIVKRDALVIRELMVEKEKWCEKSYLAILFLAPILFVPYWDVHISPIVKGISNPINQTWLHLW